jgi:hypothetical protein
VVLDAEIRLGALVAKYRRSNHTVDTGPNKGHTHAMQSVTRRAINSLPELG